MAGTALTLAQIVEGTRERAPVIRARAAEAEAMRARTEQSSLLSNPSFMLQTGAIKSATVGGSVVDVTLMQPLPFPGKRQALRSYQEATAKLSLIEGQEEILAFEHQAAGMGARLAVLDELYKHTDERRKRFDIIRQSLVARPQVSPIQKVERSLIENQLRILERGIAIMESERRALNRELALWLGAEGDLAVAVPWGEAAPLEPLNVWQDRAIQSSPTLARAKQLKQQSEARLKTAELAAYPDFQVGVNYRQEQVQPTNHFYHAQVGLTLPIIDRGQHQRDSARAEIRVNEARAEISQKMLLNELSRAWEDASTQRQLLKTFNLKLIKESERQFHAAEDEFRKGRIDATTFLSTDAQIHESVDAAFQTTLDALMSANRLRQLVGLSPVF